MARTPRIITETVERLRVVAKDLRENRPRPEAVANILDNIAQRLDEYDARETRKDPSKRKRKAKKAAKR